MNTLKAVASRLARLSVIAALLVAFTTTAYAQDSTEAPMESEQAKQEMKKQEMKKKEMAHDASAQGLVGTLKARGNFSTLVGALKKTGLAEDLQQSEQPFTLFAPTDEAFAALPAGTLDSLSADKLAGILRYHLVPGAVSSADALQQGQFASVQGANLAVKETDAGATVNGAAIVEADIEAGNSVIHVVDSVLMPEQSMGTSDAGTMEKPERDASSADGATVAKEDGGSQR